jgi:hypothetical protein
VAHGNFLQSAQAHSITATIKAAKSDPPLSVFATHSDEAGDSNKIIQEGHRATYRIRRDLGRVHRCAPGLYISAREGHRFAEEWKEKRAASSQAFRNQNKPPFEELWAYQPAATVRIQYGREVLAYLPLDRHIRESLAKRRGHLKFTKTTNTTTGSRSSQDCFGLNIPSLAPSITSYPRCCRTAEIGEH